MDVLKGDIMENDKIIIIALIGIIIALLIGMLFFALPNFNKEDTQLTFSGNTTIEEGGYINVQLTDINGNGLVGQTVNVTINDKDNSNSYYSVVTDQSGNGKLKVDKDKGDYTVTVSYSGNDDYNACNATHKVTVKEKEEEQSSQSSSSSSRSAYAYKSDGTPMYSQAEVNQYMGNKYGLVDYHIGSNGYIDMDEPGYDDAGNRLW